MKNKRQFITQEASEKIKKNLFMLENAIILPKRSNRFFEKQEDKKTPIYIYDIGFNKQQTPLPINNHINKTGLNPLRGHNKENIKFYDITNIYQQQQGAQTAECFGLNKPSQTNNSYIQTRFLCHHTIAAYCAGFKQIFAYIID